MSLLANSNAISTGGYDVNNSLRFRSSASAYLSRTPSVSSNRRTWTWSAWVKRGSLGSYQVLFGAGLNNGVNADELVSIYFTNNDQLGNYVVETGVADRNNYSTAVFRDPSAWYHIVAIYDSTQATASNRQRLFVNNVEITSWAATSYVSQNYQPSVNSSAYPHAIGKYGFNATRFFDGYMAEVNFIDGQALTPSSFGSTNATTGVWQPAQYTGTYGTNGFYLKFADASAATAAAIGKDSSGNGNNWTPNNISVTAGTTYDAMIDSPTLTSATVANYAVLNPLMSGAPFQTNAAATVSQGNLQVDWTTTGQGSILSTIAMTSGKWYFEGTVTGTNTREVIGIVNSSAATTTYVGGDANGWGYFSVNGQKYNNGSATSYGATYTTNDIIGVAFDADAGSLTFYKNGTSQGTAFTGLSAGTYFFAVADANSSLTCGWNVNFGQRPFSYTPPTGYNRLNTFNLPTSTIVKGNSYMDATLWTGNGTSQSIVNAQSFKPDFVWVKSRSIANENGVYDTVRGPNKGLFTNRTNAEDTSTIIVTALNSNGFSIGSDGIVNTNAATYVGWQWQANQGTNVTNTSGSITSTVSASTTTGCSIMTYTGTGANGTIGHGLGVAPKMVIVKSRTNAANEWCVWHTSLTNATYYLYLNGTAAQAVDTTFWNSTAPTSTVINLGSNTRTNQSTANLVAYAWAEIAGFSKFGSYTGNGSTDGPFIYLGFRPKYLMVKVISTTEDWYVWDSVRGTYNANTPILYPDLFNAESTAATDFLSNGFKPRTAQTLQNASGATYIYAAFAENPFKNALAR